MPDKQTILVSGFKFSGSSAISEYLLDFHESCCFSSPLLEPRFVGVTNDKLLSTLLDEVTSGRTATWQESDFQAYAANLRDLLLSDTPQKWLQKMNAQVRRRLGPEADKQIAKFTDVVSTMTADTTRDAVVVECNDMFRDLFTLIPGHAADKTVIVNNDPPAYGGNCGNALALYPDAKVVAVLRDPKDMYFELSRSAGDQFPRTEKAIHRWIGEMKTHIESFYDLKNRDDVCLVSFEQFVTQKTVRRKVAEFAGLSRYKKSNRLFDSSVSEKNIGHQTLDPVHADIIERELADIFKQAYSDFNSPMGYNNDGKLWSRALRKFSKSLGLMKA